MTTYQFITASPMSAPKNERALFFCDRGEWKFAPVTDWRWTEDEGLLTWASLSNEWLVETDDLGRLAWLTDYPLVKIQDMMAVMRIGAYELHNNGGWVVRVKPESQVTAEEHSYAEV